MMESINVVLIRLQNDKAAVIAKNKLKSNDGKEEKTIEGGVIPVFVNELLSTPQ